MPNDQALRAKDFVVARRPRLADLVEHPRLEPRPIDPDLLKEAKRALGLMAAEVAQALEPASGSRRAKRSGEGE
jgi:hypothetical protein